MKKERVYFIYKYVFPNGKVYIGQTYKGSGRYGNSKKYVGTFVGNAMSKYPSYKKEILEYCTKDDVDEKERYYISFYDSTDRLKGYNREFGGNEKKQLTDDLKKELSNVHIDLQVTSILQYSLDGTFIKEWKSIKEAAQTLGIDRTGISKAIHNDISKSGGYIWKIKEVYSPCNKRVISQYDLDGNFIRDWENAEQAEKELGICSILNGLNGRNKTVGGFQWKYKDSNKIIKKYETKRVYNGAHIFQYSLDGSFLKEWNSYLEAAKALNIPHQHIRRVLRGERKMTGGFIFSYEKHLDGIKKYNPEEKSFLKPVLQFDLNGNLIQEWPSIKKAGDKYGNPTGIGKCCQGKAKTCKGYKWEYK